MYGSTLYLGTNATNLYKRPHQLWPKATLPSELASNDFYTHSSIYSINKDKNLNKYRHYTYIWNLISCHKGTFSKWEYDWRTWKKPKKGHKEEEKREKLGGGNRIHLKINAWQGKHHTVVFGWNFSVTTTPRGPVHFML